MDKVISSNITWYAIASMAAFSIFTFIYANWAIDGDYKWWLADKLNDRIATINFMVITSNIFLDRVYRLFAYLNITYISWLAFCESLYILKSNNTIDWFVGDYEFAMLSTFIFIIGGILMFILSIHDSQRRN